MPIEVFKFGGASVRDAERVKNVFDILNSYSGQKIVVVMSALGKSTNQLEQVVKSYFAHDKDQAISQMNLFKTNYVNLANELLNGQHLEACLNELNDCFVEVDWVLEDEVEDAYDYLYDQIVSVGELATTKLVSAYFVQEGMNSKWFDIRNAIFTDHYFREANIDWVKTQEKINKKIPSLFSECDVILTQGFIASTDDNLTSTLGREGSDYTAAILGYSLDVEAVTIWKDVAGIMTGDPKKNDDVQKLDGLSFREAIEMTYYGAKVIHPKTIQPLQNKSIPLKVKSFVDPQSTGTIISAEKNLEYPPIIVIEENQIMLEINTRDFSFITEDHMTTIFNLISKHRIKLRLMRNSAVSFVMCIQDKHNRFDKFYNDLADLFNCTVAKNLELLTIRHYNDEVLENKVAGAKIVFSENYEDTIQLVLNRSK